MSDPSYLAPPEEVDMAAAERAIRKASTIGFFLYLLIAVGAYHPSWAISQ